MKFLEAKSIFIPFFSRIDKDMLINSIGFDNFNYVAPSKVFRVQSYCTLHVVLEGSGVLKYKKNVYKVSKGDMFFLPPNTNFCYYPSDEDPWKYAWFGLDGESALFYGEKLGLTQGKPVKKCKYFDNVYLQFEHLFTKKLKQISIGYYDALSTFYKILDYNSRDYEAKNTNLPDAIVDYIKCSYNKTDLTVATICDYFNISHSYLCRIFKESHDCSAKNYILRLRMSEACRLLETTTLSVKEIAYSVGFKDNIHFMKIFKRYLDKTPSEYRKQAIITHVSKSD